MPLEKLITGGQTGVDRGALDAAIATGFPCGGWCPAGRIAEDGPIPLQYPLVELPNGGYRQRTIQNVIDSDATLIIYFDRLQGGTEQTLLHCIRRQKPYKLIDATETSSDRAGLLAFWFTVNCNITILNIAGPRSSNSPIAHMYAYEAISKLIHTWHIVPID